MKSVFSRPANGGKSGILWHSSIRINKLPLKWLRHGSNYMMNLQGHQLVGRDYIFARSFMLPRPPRTSEVSVTMRYIFLRASRERMTSSLPRYLNLGLRTSVNGILGSLPNIKKKGLSRACSLGKKL